ncbi:reductive dehalogenase [Salinarimonas chemoclinalis]|uniref:reductive dehalogenase n=1 Tax=Salinarimonas chemoclinalis TaxID=3241599 RepID=UPI0035575345
MRFFSTRNRPVHLGPYPLERLARRDAAPDLSRLPPHAALDCDASGDAGTIDGAIGLFIGMLDAIREGAVAASKAPIPDDPGERAANLKAAGYFFDASQMGICRLPREARLAQPTRNPALDALVARIESGQTKTFSSGIDVIMADVKEAAATPPGPIDHHTHSIVVLVEDPREPDPAEPGAAWIAGTTRARSAVRAAEAAVVLANYLRLLGHGARAHTATSSDVDLERLGVAAGLNEIGADGRATNPYLGRGYALAAVTTTLDVETDRPLAPRGLAERLRSHGPAWWAGRGTLKSARDRLPYARRRFKDGAYPFERIARREKPTTFIDEPRVPRFPKRADFFARALFGDMGKAVQEKAKNGFYVLRNPLGYCSRRALGALLLLQQGEAHRAPAPEARDPQANADAVKAALYFLGADAVGISRCPDWAYYSHDAAGEAVTPYHAEAISILVDQGHETMDGTTGDDWISAAQSMRAYLRTSLIGGIVAEQIRRLGYSARVHSVLDGDVLQPPLLLLSGLGEVSRIGEVILNPYLGPRLKSGVITTDMPLAHDQPIDFGLQSFCGSCNKCARECPSGAITAGPKLMYNGYEIWKSDAEKCARYRITNDAGSMCGRCMKTCPWNLEGLFQEAPFRWLAMKAPFLAKALAKLDDAVGNGRQNKVKKWWWDIDMDPATMAYVPAAQTNRRELQTTLDLRYEDQTLAVYPADAMPPPYPVPFPMDHEAGIARYRALLTPDVYKRKLVAGEIEGLAPPFRMPDGPPPVIATVLSARIEETADTARFELVAADGSELPAFEPGAHVDVVIAPEYLRQYSLAGDPADRSRWVLGVLNEAEGKGASKLMHRAFRPGRRVFVSPPRNHFPLVEDATRSLLFAGGIGVTPMIPMAHRLHALGRDFALHYSCPSRDRAPFARDLLAAPFGDRMHLHCSQEGTRADLAALTAAYAPGMHLYACGPVRYMDAVLDAARTNLWPEEALHREYFAVPEEPDRPSFPFRLVLATSGRSVDVAADESATDALSRIGVHVETKCSSGICGVCAAGLVSGAVDHRDFALSARERERKVILCCSRAAEADGEIAVDL